MSTISEIEDKIIAAVEGTLVFKKVDSLGRRDRPAALSFPSAFPYFVSDRDLGVRPRPTMEVTFEVLVVNKNVKSEAHAAKGTYALLDVVRDAVQGKSFTLTDIEPFICSAREIVDFEDGVISYIVRFRTRHYLPVPTDT